MMWRWWRFVLVRWWWWRFVLVVKWGRRIFVGEPQG
jgi:hypothetical protein